MTYCWGVLPPSQPLTAYGQHNCAGMHMYLSVRAELLEVWSFQK
jgi:hypothetical protein